MHILGQTKTGQRFRIQASCYQVLKKRNRLQCSQSLRLISMMNYLQRPVMICISLCLKVSLQNHTGLHPALQPPKVRENSQGRKKILAYPVIIKIPAVSLIALLSP